MDKILEQLKAQLDRAVEAFHEELKKIRGDRPSIDLVENVKVSYYEEELPINQLGSLAVVPPREIQISAWDEKAVGPIMKAIENAKLGLSVSNNGNLIRAVFSSLTDERREELSKVAGKSAEEIRIRVRNHRDEAIKAIKSLEQKGEITEDDVFTSKESIQKTVDMTNKNIGDLLENKTQELKE